MNAKDNEFISLSDGEIVIWVENETSLHLKCVTKKGDPVELNGEELDELCQILQKMASSIR